MKLPTYNRATHRWSTGEYSPPPPDLFLDLEDAEAADNRQHRPNIGGSAAGAKDVKLRAGSQKARLLAAYSNVWGGLTADEAAGLADIPKGAAYWMRCHELRDMGLIEPVLNSDGQTVTRPGNAGSQQMVCAITEKGKEVLSR